MRSLYNWGRLVLAASGVSILFLPGLSPMRILYILADQEANPAALHGLVFLLVSQVAAGTLAIIASLMLKTPRPGSVRLGRIAALALIVFGVPWLILPGLFVLYALIHPPGVSTHSTAAARGKSLWWSSIFGGPALIAGWGLVMSHAPSWGLPASSLGSSIIWVWFCGEFIEITVHEFGHTLAAWAVGFRVRTICIGPLTLWNEPGKPRRVQFQWQRLLMVQGGYVGCIPTSEEGVRPNMILVVLCGPLIAIIAGMGLFSLALASPGTAWESHWDVLAAVALLFLVDSLANLIPAGNLDGAHLLHLILWTERGKAYVASLRTGKLREDAKAVRGSGDLEGELALLERALRESVDGGERRPEALASHYLALGFGLLRVQRWTDRRGQSEEKRRIRRVRCFRSRARRQFLDGPAQCLSRHATRGRRRTRLPRLRGGLPQSPGTAAASRRGFFGSRRHRTHARRSESTGRRPGRVGPRPRRASFRSRARNRPCHSAAQPRRVRLPDGHA
ncbi:MAG TPA: M50 family metallopeptidase [Bryobacteraceae bacterium]|nr:M50 family metallopeptidase [Bryobacteraceae bacterium]